MKIIEKENCCATVLQSLASTPIKTKQY